MQHHAFVIEARVEEGVKTAQEWVEKELGLDVKANPDVIVLSYGLFSVADARRVSEVAMQAPLRGRDKVIIIAASRAYHEAQNALLKIFEEPSADTHLFLILPSLGGLLPTLRSRVQILEKVESRKQKGEIPEFAHEFLKMSKEKRASLIKKLAAGKSDEDRRENRDTVIALVNGIEKAAYRSGSSAERTALLTDIAVLRGYLYDRSAPVRMILEHLSLVIPKGLV